MSCIQSGKIENWLLGNDPQVLDRDDWSHLKTCPKCNASLRAALALKAAALIPSPELYHTSLSCSHQVDDLTRAAYLDDLLGESERSHFERHLASCEFCRRSLLQLEWEIADLERDEIEVPSRLLAKAREIGEAEISRHEGRSLKEVLKGAFLPDSLRWLEPRWVGLAAVIAVAVVGSIYFLRMNRQIVPPQTPPIAQTAPAQKPTPAPTVPPQPKTTIGSAEMPGAEDAALMARAQNILTQIERAAGSSGQQPIRLDVVKSNQYIAEISPQGKLTISTQYIAATRNDDELAFLLAHEVAHRQHPANCILSFSNSTQQPVGVLNSNKEKLEELQADRLGVFLAAVAGYHANAAESLFGRIRSIPGISDVSHPAFQTRLQETEDELTTIVRNIELFRVGVSFFNTEQYSRSVAVFSEVAKLFPSREAFNDLGLAYHKLALEYSSQNWGFKEAVILDPVARAIEPTREDIPQADLFAEFLNQAMEQYRQAMTRDPQYVAAHINMASALDEKGDYAGAVKELDGVLHMSPSPGERARILNNLGVIAAKQSELEKAQSLLTQSAEADPSFADAHFNLARVLEMQKHEQAALKEYERYAQLAGHEHNGWLRMAFNKLNRPWPSADSDALETLPKLGQIQLGDSVASLENRLGSTTMTWKLETPTQLYFFVSLFKKAGLVISGSEDIIDFVQTTPRFIGSDSANRLSEGIPLAKLSNRLSRSTRVTLGGNRDCYIDFDMGVGINFRNSRVDTWYIFTPLV